MNIILLAGCASATRGGDPSLRPIFNGRTLDGWTARGGAAVFEVRDGAIVGRTRPGQPNSFLCTQRSYRDFVLECEFRVHPELNSGVQVRSNADPAYKNGVVHGYQVEIDPTSRARTGGIFDESRRGWLATLDDNPAARAAFRPGEWNRLRVRAVGDVIETWVNGVPAARLTDSMTPEGFIALQVHGVGDRDDELTVEWKNINMAEIRR